MHSRLIAICCAQVKKKTPQKKTQKKVTPRRNDSLGTNHSLPRHILRVKKVIGLRRVGRKVFKAYSYLASIGDVRVRKMST